MKKLLLNLTLLCSAWLSAQGIDNPTFVHNFSGGINQGITGVTGTYALTTNVILANDKFGNPNSAIQIDGANTLQQLTGAASGMTGNFTVGFWYKKSTEAIQVQEVMAKEPISVFQMMKRHLYLVM
jgi:hypothetical protein